MNNHIILLHFLCMNKMLEFYFAIWYKLKIPIPRIAVAGYLHFETVLAVKSYWLVHEEIDFRVIMNLKGEV